MGKGLSLTTVPILSSHHQRATHCLAKQSNRMKQMPVSKSMLNEWQIEQRWRFADSYLSLSRSVCLHKNFSFSSPMKYANQMGDW